MDKFLLRSAIVRKGFTQETLARELGISQNTLSAKILGKSFFNTDEIDRICELLEITDNEEKALIFLSKLSRNRDRSRGEEANE